MGIVAGSGALHGLWTDRWMASPDLEASADKLAGVSKVLGDWVADETADKKLELDPKAQAMGGIVGYLGRKYVNRRTKSQVEVVVVCGRPGHISVHTPESCYAGHGYEMAGSPSQYSFSDDSFWWAQFRKEGVPPLRILWAWNAVGPWQAPKYPRFAFARYPVLFKLYLIHPFPDRKEPADKDPAPDLMKQLLPELQRCLFPET